MIEISYTDDGDPRKSNCDIYFDDEATLTDVLYGFIKVCEFAGYSAGSFDCIVEGMEEGESFKDYITDCVYELDCCADESIC